MLRLLQAFCWPDFEFLLRGLHHPHRIDEAEVSPDQFGEGSFRVSVGVLAEESGVIVQGVS